MEEDVEVQGHLTCAVCMEVYDDPRVLPCQHTFCRHCLQQIVNMDGAHCLRCPECRGPVQMSADGVKGLPRNCKLASLVACFRKHQSLESSTSSAEVPLTIPTMLVAMAVITVLAIPMHADFIGFSAAFPDALAVVWRLVHLCAWMTTALALFPLWCAVEAVWSFVGSVVLLIKALFYSALALVFVLVCALLLPGALVFVKEVCASDAVQARWEKLKRMLDEEDDE